MLHVRRPPAVAGLCLTLLLTATGPVVAGSAPPNDTFAGATVIAGLPYAATLDTTGATTDATDAAANAGCGAPATQASVWYAYTPPVDQNVIVDVSASSYEAGVIVVTGAPSAFVLQACGPGLVEVAMSAGVTYYLLAFDDVPGSTGGTLSISVTVAPPPPTVAVTVTGATVNPKTGVATISGLVSCSGAAGAIKAAATSAVSYVAAKPAAPIGGGVDVSVFVSQNVGRIFTITGFGDGSAACGTAVPWSDVVPPSSGLFKPGMLTVAVDAFACNISGCADDSHTVTIRATK